MLILFYTLCTFSIFLILTGMVVMLEIKQPLARGNHLDFLKICLLSGVLQVGGFLLFALLLDSYNLFLG